MSSLDSVEVHLVDDVATADAFLTWLSERRPHLAIDTETTGFDWWTKDFLRLVQFGDAQTSYVVPVHRWRGVADLALSRLKAAAAPTTFLNWKFDAHALESDGLPTPHLPCVHDVGTMDRLIHPLEWHTLKGIGERLFGEGAVMGDDILKNVMAGSRGEWGWATIPYDHPAYWFYSGFDTILTARIAEHHKPLLSARDAYEREMAVSEVMYRAEKRGLRVDLDYTNRLRSEWALEIRDLEVELEAQGIENPGSNIQVAEVLKAAGWEPDEFTDTGQIKLDKEILAVVERTFPGVAVPLVRYKRLVKWSAAYLDHFLLKADDSQHVHAGINTMAARTGRMSITNPALQTLPRGNEIRDCVIPDEGHDLWTIDYAGMEMVSFTDFCGDPGLVEAIVNNEDLHTYCASLAFNVPPELVTKEQRQVAKNTNFSRIYGAGPDKIAHTAGVPVAEIHAYLRGFDQRFPEAPTFMRSVIEAGRHRLSTEGEAYVTTVGGRRLPCDPDKIYVLVNYLIQGSCADIFKDAILRVDAAGYGDNIIVPVHDELVFQFPTGDTESPAEARRIMEDHTYHVPFRCEADGPLERWGEKYA